MTIWLRRIFVIWLLSLGIAMLFLPFNNTKSGSISEEVVTLEKQIVLNPDDISAQYPGVDIVELTDSELNREAYPCVAGVIRNLRKDYPNDFCELEKWNKFQLEVLKEKSEPRLILYWHRLVYCSLDKGKTNPVVQFKYLGDYYLKIKEFTKEDLSHYPLILDAVKHLEAADKAYSDQSIPQGLWYKMVNKHLDPFEDAQTFKYNGNYYGPQFGWDTRYMEGEVKQLALILRIIGTIAILAGMFLARRLYNPKHGIMINPQRVAILWDVIVMIFTIVAAYMVVCTVLLKGLFVTPFFNDDFSILMGNFFFFFSVPLVAFYISRLSFQSIEIDTDGIKVDSLRGKDTISWDSLESMDFSDEYVMVGRVGVLVPRQLQKRLKIKDTAGHTIIINEPQLKSVKRDISLKFEQYAPVELIEKIKVLMNKW